MSEYTWLKPREGDFPPSSPTMLRTPALEGGGYDPLFLMTPGAVMQVSPDQLLAWAYSRAADDVRILSPGWRLVDRVGSWVRFQYGPPNEMDAFLRGDW